MKKAFTLVELLFVMVVLAIIAGVGTDILRSLFDNYAVTAQIHRLESVANNAADTIAARLEKRVPQTTAIETSTDTGAKNYEPLSAIDAKNGKLVFFRKAYELERNFISAKKGGAAAPRTSGFISELETTTKMDSGKLVDEVKFININETTTGTTGIKITATFSDTAATGTTNAMLVSATATGKDKGDIIDGVKQIKLNGFAFNIGTEPR